MSKIRLLIEFYFTYNKHTELIVVPHNKLSSACRYFDLLLHAFSKKSSETQKEMANMLRDTQADVRQLCDRNQREILELNLRFTKRELEYQKKITDLMAINSFYEKELIKCNPLFSSKMESELSKVDLLDNIRSKSMK